MGARFSEPLADVAVAVIVCGDGLTESGLSDGDADAPADSLGETLIEGVSDDADPGDALTDESVTLPELVADGAAPVDSDTTDVGAASDTADGRVDAPAGPVKAATTSAISAPAIPVDSATRPARPTAHPPPRC